MSELGSFWWQGEEAEAAKDVFATVRTLEQSQSELRKIFLFNARLYSNADLPGLDWTTSQQSVTRRPYGRNTENIIQSVVDTATSKIAANRPRAVVSTDDADFTTQRRAKLLESFIEAQMHRLGVYDLAALAFRDSCVFGTGALKVFEEDGEVCVERVVPDELIVDECECRSAYPRTLYQRKFVDRSVLIHDYPESAEAIEQAKSGVWSGRRLDKQQVVVIEAWRLPSGRGADDGVHTICIDGETLLWERYKKATFPFVFYRWTPPLIGFYGQGLAEQLTGIQLEVTKLRRFIRLAQDTISVPRVFVHRKSKILTEHLIDSEIAKIIHYEGQPPVFLSPPAVAQDIYLYVERLSAKAYEIAGISQLSAQSKKPSGLDSAVALREFSDQETSRFAMQSQSYESMILEVAQRIVEVAKAIYARRKKPLRLWNTTNVAELIQWSDVDMDEDMYRMKIDAASLMARSPAARQQQVREWFTDGVIDQDEYRRLLDHPDLKRSATLMNAAINDIEATIENLCAGKYEQPEPFQNLELGIVKVQEAYLDCRRRNAPEPILELFRRWMKSAEQLIPKSAPASAAPTMAPPPMGGPPPGAPPMGPPPMEPPGMPMAA